MKSLNGVAVVAAWGALVVGGLVEDAAAQTTWTVCHDGTCDFTDVQSAIDASSPGDTVQLHAETFSLTATLSNNGKAIRILGTLDTATQHQTVLDGHNTVRLMQLSGTGVTVENLTLTNGFSNDRGGAIYMAADSAVDIIDCTFIGNSTSDLGGAVCSLLSSPRFIRCHFEANTGGTNGGALYLIGSYSTFIDSTITANVAPYGSGVFLAGGCSCQTAFIGTTVCGNLNTTGHPLQVLAAGNNSWTADAGTCISSDCLPCYPDCNGDGISDADEIAAGAADLNGNGVPDTCECIADLTGNGEVNGADISIILGFWGKVPEPLPAADINQDGLVNGLDLGVLLGNWGPCQ